MCFYRLKKLAYNDNLKLNHAFGKAVKDLFATRVALTRTRESCNYANEPFKIRF